MSILDIGNPMVFVHASDFQISATDTVGEINARHDLLETFEDLRLEGARRLGLVNGGVAVSASIPSVALVSRPRPTRPMAPARRSRQSR